MNAQALEKSFGNLRERWPNGWPGLPLVLQQCLRQLQLLELIRTQLLFQPPQLVVALLRSLL